MRSLLIVIAAVSLFTSCRPTRKIQTAITKADTINAIKQPVRSGEDSSAFIRENYTRIKTQKIPFTTFSAKIDVDYEGGDGKKESANAILRMYKDSVIYHEGLDKDHKQVG
jgi:hypothetical protein